MSDQDYHTRTVRFFHNTKSFGKASSAPINPDVFPKPRQFEFRKIVSFAQLPKDARVIELGAGFGRYVLPLLYLGYTVTAVDIGERLLQTIQNVAEKYHLKSHLKTIHSNFRSITFKDKYDIALCISTFHLLAETEKERCQIFSNLVKTVKPSGSVIVVEPNPLNPFLYIYYWFGSPSWYIEKHFLKSSVWNLKRIFSQAGLSDITVEYVGFLPMRYMDIPGVKRINDFVNNMPILNLFSSFIYIKGVKRRP